MGEAVVVQARVATKMMKDTESTMRVRRNETSSESMRHRNHSRARSLVRFFPEGTSCINFIFKNMNKYNIAPSLWINFILKVEAEYSVFVVICGSRIFCHQGIMFA